MTRYKLVLAVIALVLVLPPFLLEYRAGGDWRKYRSEMRDFIEQGRFREAEKIADQALKYVERTASKGHTDAAVALTDLGDIKLTLGDYEAAETLYSRAFEIMESANIAETMQVATASERLGQALAYQGRFPTAETLLKRAARISEKIEGPYGLTVAHNLAVLGGFYQDWGFSSKAESLLRRSVDIVNRNKVLIGTRERDNALFAHAEAVQNLVRLYLEQGRLEEAELQLELINTAINQSRYKMHPVRISMLLSEAKILQARADYNKAELLILEAIKLQEHSFGTTHPDIILCFDTLAAIYQKQKRVAEAEKMLFKSLDIAQHASGSNPPRLAQTQMQLGVFYEEQNKFSTAAEYYEKALQIRRKTFAASGLYVIDSMENLARVYRKMGRTELSRKIEAQLQEMRQGQEKGPSREETTG